MIKKRLIQGFSKIKENFPTIKKKLLKQFQEVFFVDYVGIKINLRNPLFVF